MYLAPDGKRCAAGWCVDEMPPELSSYESSWRAVPIAIREAVGHEALVRQLQRDHDNPAIGGRGLRVSEWRNAWRSNMSRTLANLNLDATVLTTLATDAWVANGPSK
jgi:hypothetical protein